MVTLLTVEYDAAADILYLSKTKPYAEQESEEVDYGVIARLNPSSREIENLEVLFFTARAQGSEGLKIPVHAEFSFPHGE
jgi:hypothetical protein